MTYTFWPTVNLWRVRNSDDRTTEVEEENSRVSYRMSWVYISSECLGLLM